LTYNVFGGTLNLAQSINSSSNCLLIASISYRDDTKLSLSLCEQLTTIRCTVQTFRIVLTVGNRQLNSAAQEHIRSRFLVPVFFIPFVVFSSAPQNYRDGTRRCPKCMRVQLKSLCCFQGLKYNFPLRAHGSFPGPLFIP